ncbi:hypothetical protein AQUCO_00300342v1 [Aquilegia coerulea]|uniref:Uncharacterized protein n=1 Tax=Aquilegia coerulea TaxID=218851 RepID=A0A2G5EYE6_AQUCA|nr:hypothetical protein AQUCO_00300342v1 [Aquilegia coerulea]
MNGAEQNFLGWKYNYLVFVNEHCLCQAIVLLSKHLERIKLELVDRWMIMNTQFCPFIENNNTWGISRTNYKFLVQSGVITCVTL